MRQVSDRFRALIPYPNQWTTKIEWSNDGWRTVHPATFLDGSCTASALDQIRWSCDLQLADVEASLDGINAYSTQIRILHGLNGEMLPMGVYKVRTASLSSDARATVKVKGSSFECYLIRASFISTRTFQPMSGSALVRKLIGEILPNPSLAWETADDTLPKIIEPTRRWGLIDGDRNDTSVAKALGARIYAGPSGNWIARDVPTLDDDPVWEAAEGDGGVLLTHSEDLTDDGVYNTVVVSGQSTNTDYPPFKNGVAQDLDPSSPTYVGKSAGVGGFGPSVKYYSSAMITSSAKAQKAAEGMLAPCLGLRQQVAFSQLHDPTLEPGDVGIVYTANGPRKVLLDSVTYSLLGQPLTGQTRTSATTLVGDAYIPPDDDEDTSGDS